MTEIKLPWKNAEDSARQKVVELLVVVESILFKIEELKQEYKEFPEDGDEKEKSSLALRILEGIVYNSKRVSVLLNQKTYYNELVERELLRLNSEYRKYISPYENELGKEFLKIIEKYHNALCIAIEVVDGLKYAIKRAIQFQVKTNPSKYKKLNLTITYGNSTRQSSDVSSIIYELKE